MTGRVMMRVTSSTSRTSMSGVVLMSHMGPALEPPTFMDMLQSSSMHPERTAIGLGDESDLDHPAALQLIENAPDGLVAGIQIAADMDLRLRVSHRLLLDHGEQLRVVSDLLVVPVHVASDIHRNGDVLG